MSRLMTLTGEYFFFIPFSFLKDTNGSELFWGRFPINKI